MLAKSKFTETIKGLTSTLIMELEDFALTEMKALRDSKLNQVNRGKREAAAPRNMKEIMQSLKDEEEEIQQDKYTSLKRAD